MHRCPEGSGFRLAMAWRWRLRATASHALSSRAYGTGCAPRLRADGGMLAHAANGGSLKVGDAVKVINKTEVRHKDEQ